MTDPATALPPEWQQWQAGLTEPLPEGQVADDTVNVRLEVVVAASDPPIAATRSTWGATRGQIRPTTAPSTTE